MWSDPKTVALALVTGIIPSLLWLWFWLHEDKKKPEPKFLLTLIFFMGMLAVVFVLPIQKFIRAQIASPSMEIFLWAAAEEILKYIAVLIIILNTREAEEPIDWPIYLITAGVGFAALENTLFLLKPFSLDQATVGLLTGHLRFLGSTLLHTVASASVGIGIGLSFHMRGLQKKVYLFSGLAAAIVLHTVFNFFIIRNDGSDFLTVFGFLWVVAVVVMLVFEKLRRMT